MIANHSPHGPHITFLGLLATSSAASPPQGDQRSLLDPESGEAHELLESLDDAMFEAIGGDSRSVEKAQRLWERATAALPAELVEESREQYLRFAVDVSRRAEADGCRDASSAVWAMEIIALLAS